MDIPSKDPDWWYANKVKVAQKENETLVEVMEMLYLARMETGKLETEYEKELYKLSLIRSKTVSLYLETWYDMSDKAEE